MILRRLAVFSLVLWLWAPPASADAPKDAGASGPRRVTEGTLLWRTAQQQTPTPAPLLATDVEMRVTGLVVRATVRQEFSNPSAEWAEGVYVFPLPEDAAVDRLKMRIGDRVVEGVIRERVAAKQAYEQARQQGQRASLVEQERPNVFTTSVANIPPGAAVAVEIEYQQAVRYDGGRFRLRFPMVVGPRYIPGAAALGVSGLGWAPDTDAVPDASRITPPVRYPARGPANPVTLRIELDPAVPLAGVESPSHAIDTTPLAAGRYEVTLQPGGVPADRDFELVWAPVAGAAPAAVLLTEARGDEVFALLMVMPPAPGAAARERLPREAVFVVDHSGSMAGASMQQARAALKLALARLRPTDHFNVIRFNHRTEGLFQEARPASPQNLGLAGRYVDALRADGGTEILPALVRALDGGEHPDRLRQVIFLTDGSVGNEEQLFQAIRERLGDSRLFTVGIGSAPNSHFMREAARAGRGTFTYIGSTTEVQQKMTELFGKLESPALVDLRLELPGAGDAEILPLPLPDLYAGEPVVVALRTKVPPTRAVLRGRRGSRAWESEVPLHDAAAGAGLAAHWARAKIAALLDQRRSGAAGDDIRHAVIDVALRHHLVSAYTSLVAVDVTPARPAGAPLTSHALETNLPHGWEYDAVFGSGQGATAGPLHLAVGLAALAAAAALRLWMGRADALAPMRHRRGRP
jgi:Ca-activated chloride channel family protein